MQQSYNNDETHEDIIFPKMERKNIHHINIQYIFIDHMKVSNELQSSSVCIELGVSCKEIEAAPHKVG